MKIETEKEYENALLELNEARLSRSELEELTDAVYEFVNTRDWVSLTKDSVLADFVEELPEGIDEKANEAFLRDLGFTEFYSPDFFPEGGHGDYIYIVKLTEDEIRKIASENLKADIEARNFQP